MSITKEDVQRCAELGVDLRPGSAPLATARLVELIAELQARVAQLEQSAPKRRGLLSAFGRRCA